MRRHQALPSILRKNLDKAAQKTCEIGWGNLVMPTGRVGQDDTSEGCRKSFRRLMLRYRWWFLEVASS
jgi:hypothetical protein